jgi:DNA-binding transcriptional ArsR family regulator
MKPALNGIAEIDRVIHEPARLMIVALLFAVEKADFVYLQYETGLNKGNLSSHIAKLEAAGYLAVEKTFRGKVPHAFEPDRRGARGIYGVPAHAEGVLRQHLARIRRP